MNYSSLFSRTRVLSLCVLIFGLILVGKLFLVQVVHNNSYLALADHQYATPSSDIFERGTIYFVRKDGVLVSAATQASGFKIAINPTELLDPNGTYQKINYIVAINQADFIAKASKKNDPYEEVANRLTKEEADAVSALKITGVSLYQEKWRFYPGGDMAAHTLGIVGYKGNDLGGRYGLEREYNDVLSQNANTPYVNFFAEVFSNLRNSFLKEDESTGSLVTTIEPSVQEFLSQEITAVQSEYQADSIGGIIMNPKDGSIYAIDAKPSFDPNDFSEVKDPSIFANPLIEHVFEFGSVVKPLVMAAALDQKVLTPETTYDDKGEVTVDNKQIYNFDKKGRGPGTTMQDVLTQSLNTGMVFVAGKLGHQNVRDYLLAYDIGKKTGIDLPNETSGLVSNIITSPRDLEYANAAFGQGIAMTPMEIIRALASLSNGGNLVVPHVVQSIKYDDGTEKDMTYPTTRAKISEQTSEEITSMLVTVMDKSFDKLSPGIEHYSIAVKTGTAQVAKPNGGGYYDDRHTHSFFGYFPAYNPQFIIFLYAENPKGVQYAATTWAGPFLDIAKFLINYYDVPPDR